MAAIKDNLAVVRQRIASACSKAGRNPQTITIVAVTKGRSIDQIKEVVQSGITEIGENRLQEALLKYNESRSTLPAGQAGIHDPRINWHMIGHLQTNKVKDAVKIFKLIHSVDSLRLMQEINQQAKAINKIQDILLEIKTSPEATKSGFSPAEIGEVFKESLGLSNINIKGLMTIASIQEDPEKTRPYFQLLRNLRDNITESRLPALGFAERRAGKAGTTNHARLPARQERLFLSMGMTDDFEIAIEEGADIVRLGRAIFEGYDTI